MKAPRRPADSSHDGVAAVLSENSALKAIVIEIVKAIARYLMMGGADSVERFAEKHDISRAQAYKEIAAGRLIAREVGDKGWRTIITTEDAAAWRQELPKVRPKDAAVKSPDDRGNGLLANSHRRSRERPSASAAE